MCYNEFGGKDMKTKKKISKETKKDSKRVVKKKYGLFKVLLVMLLLVVVVTYFVKDRDGSISYLAFGDVFVNYVQSFYYFFDTAIFVVVVGGLYGALNKTLTYKKLVKSVAKVFDNKKKIFVVVSTIVFALLSSLAGFDMLLFIFIPFVVSVILVLGYDKLVALSSTVLAVAVGFIGGVFLTFKDSSSYYGTSYTTFDSMVGLDGHFETIIPRIILLVLAVGLLIFYIMNHIKKLENGEVKDEFGNNDVFLVEAKTKDGKVVKVNDSKVSVWPLVVMFVVLLILLVLGYLPWSDLFGIDIFNDFHTWLNSLSIGNYTVFSSLISSQFAAFGNWGSLGSFMMAMVLIAIFLVVLKFVAKVKFSDIMDGFIYGAKKMVPVAMILMLGYTLLVCAYNNGFFETIITNVANKFGDNVVIDALISLVGGIVHVDVYYTTAGVFSSVVSNLTEKANLSVYSVMFQSLFGLVQVFGPTSLLLVTGLSYLEVPYSKWLKYIWRFILGLVIIIFVTLMILSLV